MSHGPPLGNVRRIDTESQHFRCHTNVVRWRATVVVTDEASNATVAQGTVPRERRGAITIVENNEQFPYEIRRPDRIGNHLAASMVVADGDDRSIVTLNWIEARQHWKRFGIGRAVVGVTSLDREFLLLVVALSFELFALGCSAGGGG